MAAAERPNLVKSQKLTKDSKTMPPAKESSAKRLDMVRIGRRFLALNGLTKKGWASDASADALGPPLGPLLNEGEVEEERKR